MKKLEALIDPLMLRTVKAALTSDGVIGLTISEVKTAASSRHTESYRGSCYSVDWSPRIKLELLVPGRPRRLFDRDDSLGSSRGARHRRKYIYRTDSGRRAHPHGTAWQRSAVVIVVDRAAAVRTTCNSAAPSH